MVERLFELLHRKVRGLHEAAYLLGSFALLSQILALIRDRLLAHSFGAGAELDVYYAAFRIPDILFVSFASLVSVYVLIPFLAEKTAQSKHAERAFIDTMFSGFGITIVSAAIIAYIFTPALLSFLFPSLSASPLSDELVLLSRILLIQPILLGFSSLFGSITQTAGRFILYAVGPLLYNIGIIGGIIFLYPVFGLSGLALGVICGAFLHLAIQIPYVLQNGFFPRFHFGVDWRSVKKVAFFSLPRTLALSFNQLALLTLFVLASRMIEGSITVLQFSYNLQAVPLAIIGVSYSVAAFPTLARLISNGEREIFLVHVFSAARHIIFWSFPAIAFFVVLRAQIVRVILGSGQFDWTATRLVAASLAILVIALAAQSLSMLLVRGYYAAGNTKTPLIVNGVGAFCTILFAFGSLFLFNTYPTWQFFLESLLRVSGLPGTAIITLSLGYTLSLIGVATTLLILFRRDFGAYSLSLRNVFLESVAAAVALGVVGRIALDILDNIFDINTFFGIFFQGFIAGCVGIVAGILTLHLLKNKELAEAWQSFHKKFWRTKTVASEQTEL